MVKKEIRASLLRDTHSHNFSYSAADPWTMGVKDANPRTVKTPRITLESPKTQSSQVSMWNLFQDPGGYQNPLVLPKIHWCSPKSSDAPVHYIKWCRTVYTVGPPHPQALHHGSKLLFWPAVSRIDGWETLGIWKADCIFFEKISVDPHSTNPCFSRAHRTLIWLFHFMISYCC